MEGRKHRRTSSSRQRRCERAKVSVDAIREGMAGRGFLKKDPSGAVSSTGRSDFHRAKIELLKDKLQEGDGLIWLP